VDGIISLPVAILGFIFLPDMPENTRAWYFSPEEKAFAVKRMQLEGRKGREPYTRAKFKKVGLRNQVQREFKTDLVDLHLLAHLRAYVAVHYLQQRWIRSCAGLRAVSQEEQGSQVRSLADQRIPHCNSRCDRSNDTCLCLEL
jgi:hypothetical protein